MKLKLVVLLLIAPALFLCGCGPGGASHANAQATRIGPASLYPNPQLTSGEAFSSVTAQEVCTDGYARSVRHVSVAEKKRVFAEYGIPWSQHRNYEVDHFISLELGGDNSIANLWPEAYRPLPGARQKDVVENYLHSQVCDGNLTLAQAQQEITGDWYAIYLKVKDQPRTLHHHYLRYH